MWYNKYMKLNYDKRSKDPTYFVQMGVRNGKKTTTKNVARIGKHSELLKITDDPMEYAKQVVARYNEEARENNKVSLELKLNFNESIKAKEDAVSKSTLKNIGYLYLQKLYNELCLDMFFNRVTKDSKITFDPNQVNMFLTYARILDPDSKLGTHQKLGNYYGSPEFEYQHIMRTLDIIYKNRDEYIEHLFKKSNKIVPRDTTVCYYDCTNYYCESEHRDEEGVDPTTGEVVPGLREYGFAKDHKPNPLVEMGLFMDKNGIPISMCIAPGNTNEQTTVLPLEKQLVHMLDENNKRFIYCADAGLGSYHIRKFNSMGGRSFVITQSIKKLSAPLQEAIFNDYDYKLLSNDHSISVEHLKTFDRENMDNFHKNLYEDKAYKLLVADKLVDLGLKEDKVLENGKLKKVKSKATLHQHLIVTFSRKSMEYQRYIRNNQIERAKKILASMDPDEYKKGSNDVKRFIKKVGSGKDKYILDEEAIKEEEKYDGYYAIATDLSDDVKEILAINNQRYQIEDCFRIMKTNFGARPYYHYNRERIIAHFITCYTALLIYRMMEFKLKKQDQSITTCNIIETMKNMQVANLDDLCYISTFEGSKTLTALEAAFDMGLDKKYYTPKELNKKTRKIF